MTVYKSVIVHGTAHMRPPRQQNRVSTVNTTGLCFIFGNGGQPLGPLHAAIKQVRCTTRVEHQILNVC